MCSRPLWFILTLAEGWKVEITFPKFYTVYQGERVLAEGCFLRTSDDCVAIYGSRWDNYGGASDIIVRNMVLWADVAHPMMIGTHGDYRHQGDILEDIEIRDFYRDGRKAESLEQAGITVGEFAGNVRLK